MPTASKLLPNRKLTKRFIDQIEPCGKDVFHWDSVLPGFGLRLSPKGVKTYIVQCRSEGKTQRVKIGRVTSTTCDEARKAAVQILGKLGSGENPARTKRNKLKSPMIKDIVPVFIEDHVRARLKPGSQSNYLHVLTKHIVPHFGSFRLADITPAEIERLHVGLRDKPATANRSVRVFSKLFNFCDSRDMTFGALNPCRHVEFYKEKRRTWYLDEIELKRLWDTLQHVEDEGSVSAYAVNAYRLLILTGCRLNEVRTLKWSFLRGRHVELPDSKTGYRRIPLSDAALRVTRAVIRQEGNEYMFCGDKPGQPIVNLQKSWRRIRVRAGLTDVRIHDLRHTFASQAVMKGMPLALVSRLLGHSKITTTMRYAHLADKELAEATNQIGQMLDFS